MTKIPSTKVNNKQSKMYNSMHRKSSQRGKWDGNRERYPTPPSHQGNAPRSKTELVLATRQNYRWTHIQGWKDARKWVLSCITALLDKQFCSKLSIYIKRNIHFEPAVLFWENLSCSNKGIPIKGIYIAVLFVTAKPGNSLNVYLKGSTSQYIHTTVNPNHSHYQKG